MDSLAALLHRQSGVVSRKQLRAIGHRPHEIRSMLARRDLTVLFPGVMVDHTGDPTWLQQAWGAALWGHPAALCGESAIRAYERDRLQDTAKDVIQIAVDRPRKLTAPEGIDVTRRVRLDERALWTLSPPRLRYDEAVVDLACEAADDLDAVATLAQACASRRTTAKRLVAVIDERPRVARRSWLLAVLRDIGDGTHSVLEHGYLVRVERPHGLPTPHRQLVGVTNGARTYRDVDHGLVVIELDGLRFHNGARRRDHDLERDLDVAVEDRTTVRLGWGQVFRRPCSTAVKVGTVLQNHGWEGAPHPCASPECAVWSIGARTEHRSTT